MFKKVLKTQGFGTKILAHTLKVQNWRKHKVFEYIPGLLVAARSGRSQKKIAPLANQSFACEFFFVRQNEEILRRRLWDP